VHFGDENFLARYKLFEQNLPQWKTQYPKLASVDTRYENQVVLEMQTGTPVPVSGGDSASLPSTDTPASAAAAATPPAKPPAAAKKPASRPAKGTMSKQKIEAMLAAARKGKASKGLRQ